MRFVQKWSYSCARHLALVLNENHNRRSVYYYGFYIVFGTLVKGIILISVALLLGILVPSLLIVLVLSSLRLVAGGYHFDTYGKCLLVSLILIVIAALITQHTYIYWSTAFIAVFVLLVFSVSFYMLAKYAPKDTPTKPITDPQAIKRFKKLSIAYLGILLIISCILLLYNLKMHVLAISFGVLFEIFSITPAGHSFFNKIRDSLSRR
ncbi:accessory protein regulator protein B [Ruminiclostridium hungatei]|uniref:Accessory protein regulator protein B n=1 Tax=Ruminiclostridium hungatei TaxID=48256 RepID=A0A1V4SH79_RUMHU|nr:accessory gene regulator B family protein [Ruminiclostridium hungatei]OPX43228.1 accessory protein regulator protein B [Ruminiclostridium hungatei]